MRFTTVETALSCSLLVASAHAQSTQLMSVSSSGGQGNSWSDAASISADGRYVAFYSEASNLVAGDTNQAQDVFVRDRQSGQTLRVSVDSSGAQVNGSSFFPAISADGRFVAFTSYADSLVPGDTNMKADTFVHDMLTGETTRVSVDSNGAQADDESFTLPPAISGDGRYVAFSSVATNLVAGDTNGKSDIFVHDRRTGQTTRVSVSSAGAQANDASYFPALSADGRYVAFESAASNLVPGDTNARLDIFVHDLQTGATTRASVSSSGVQGNDDSEFASLSADGRYVAFLSYATNLVPGDVGFASDIFVRDMQSGTTTCASVNSSGVFGNSDSMAPVISANGRYVAFASGASNLVPGDTNQATDSFVHDLFTRQTTRVNLDSSGSQSAGDAGNIARPWISADGRWLAFVSWASDLAPDTNGFGDIFVRDRGRVQPTPFCTGDGLDPRVSTLCPCLNFGSVGHGCANSVLAAGALLTADGGTNPDTMILSSSSELPASLTVFFQGTVDDVAGVLFGDGVGCVSGNLKRLFVKSAVSGMAVAPAGRDPSITMQSALLGDPIPAGQPRYYQTYYRDPGSSFCSGLGFNVTNGIRVDW